MIAAAAAGAATVVVVVVVGIVAATAIVVGVGALATAIGCIETAGCGKPDGVDLSLV